MSFNTAFKLSTAFSGVTLVAFSSIHGATARLAASSDNLREKSIKTSSTISFTKVKGDECNKFETDITSNKGEVIENNVDVGILACGGDLICLEDESSSTGARCVDSKEVSFKPIWLQRDHHASVPGVGCWLVGESVDRSIGRSVGRLASLVTAAAVDLLSLVTAAAAAAAAAAALCGKAGVRHLVVDGLVAHLLP
eukprot:scaffold224438_cov33-Cyclotella_meneghiniana.AAC.1